MPRFRVVTVARQYGSGGGPIARKLAQRLGWDLLDSTLITRVAQAAKVDRSICEQFDESIDSWLHRLAKRAFGRGAFERVANADIFDGDAMALLARQLIEECARVGNCVIVGRGGQCVLEGRPDVFHVFVYAPMQERIRKVAEKFGPEHANSDAIRESDRQRAAYVKHHYNREWCDPHLYDAMFNAKLGDETVVEAILAGMRVAPLLTEQHAGHTQS